MTQHGLSWSAVRELMEMPQDVLDYAAAIRTIASERQEALA